MKLSATSKCARFGILTYGDRHGFERPVRVGCLGTIVDLKKRDWVAFEPEPDATAFLGTGDLSRTFLLGHQLDVPIQLAGMRSKVMMMELAVLRVEGNLAEMEPIYGAGGLYFDEEDAMSYVKRNHGLTWEAMGDWPISEEVIEQHASSLSEHLSRVTEVM